MARFGQNRYGENLFRIVHADSRRFIVAGEWQAGELKGRVCASEELLYPMFATRKLLDSDGVWHGGYIDGVWILEKWQGPDMSRARWEIERPALPFEERGDYHFSHAFDSVGPVDSNLDKLISWIQEGEKRSQQEVYNGCRDSYAAEKKANQNQAYDRIRDSLSAHLDFPMSGAYAMRNSKTKEMRLTAEQAGMPTGFNHVTDDHGLSMKFGHSVSRKQNIKTRVTL